MADGATAGLADIVAAVEQRGGSVGVVDPQGSGSDLLLRSVTHDSRTVESGTVFACLRGDRFDGHEFAAGAVAAGASLLVVDHELPRSDVGDTPQLIVDDTRLRLGPISSAVYGHPSEQLITVGITGTNGKTTTAQLLAAVFEANGWPTGVIGTLHGTRTTPEAPELQATLAGFVERGLRAAVLEVSSHALALHRVDGTQFDAVVFTNLGRDHLDLHGSPEEYFRAKAALFTPEFSPLAAINADDTHGRLLIDAVTAAGDQPRVVPFGSDRLSEVEVTAERHTYSWRDQSIDVPLGGAFNVLNSLAAVTVAAELGVPGDVAAQGLSRVAPVRGRFEVVADPRSEVTVVVDYAHTPDGLDEVLTSARGVVGPEGSVIAVFGCGGERDVEKRPEMGAVAARLADRVVVTSDNPRHEDPDAIVEDIVAGVEHRYRARVTSNTDRRAAIGTALAAAGRGDVVVIAGKGHEKTQDLGDTCVPFDDRSVAEALLEELQ
ncbi:MAG: UDP-N-acetylmuramoyl-L-alanyl-D-glutamate--2,6-diaminopimelate ligase [Ilumatobacteraceae bacterium]